jgi:hypothetical protein
VEGIAAASGVPVQEIRRAEKQLARPVWRRLVWPVMMAAAASLLGVFVVIQVGSILQEEKRSQFDERVKVAEAPLKDRLSVSNVAPTNKAAAPAFGDEGKVAVPAAEKREWPAATSAPRKGAPGVQGLEINTPQPAASQPALPAAPAPMAAQQAAPADVVADVGRGQAQVQAQAAPKEQRQAEEPPRLEERIPPQVATQLRQFGPVSGAAGKGGAPAKAAAPSTAPETKAAGEYIAQAKEAAPPKGVETEKAAETQMGREEAKKGDQQRVRDELQVLGAAVVQPKAASVESETVETAKALTGKAESKTLTLRAQDIPAATAEVKEILVRNGAQLSRDYYAGGGLEGAGARLNARLPAARYPSVLTELREKDYLAPESAKPLAKARKAKAAAKPSGAPEVIDLSIRFEASVTADGARPAK